MSRRKNLRLHNIDAEDDSRLLVRTANREAIAPSTSTVGKEFDAICLFGFAIKDSAVNVPPIGIREMHPGAGASSKEAMELLNQSRYRIACHAMPIDPGEDSDQPLASHSTGFLKNPFREAKSKEEFLLWSTKFPIYVGDYADSGPGSDVGPLPGTHLRVRDNSVQGGTYGSIIDIYNSKYNQISSQFVAGTPTGERTWEGSAPILVEGFSPSDATIEGFNPDDYVYPESYFKWKDLYPSAKARELNLNNSPATQQHLNNLERFTREILDPLMDNGLTFRINSGYRSPAVNAAVSGATHSQHADGNAFDLRFDGADGSNRQRQFELFEFEIPAIIGNYHQMIIYEDTNHIHIGYGSSGQNLVHTNDGRYVGLVSYTGPLNVYRT
jgi:hypothetical protein